MNFATGHSASKASSDRLIIQTSRSIDAAKTRSQKRWLTSGTNWCARPTAANRGLRGRDWVRGGCVEYGGAHHPKQTWRAGKLKRSIVDTRSPRHPPYSYSGALRHRATKTTYELSNATDCKGIQWSHESCTSQIPEARADLTRKRTCKRHSIHARTSTMNGAPGSDALGTAFRALHQTSQQSKAPNRCRTGITWCTPGCRVR